MGLISHIGDSIWFRKVNYRQLIMAICKGPLNPWEMVFELKRACLLQVMLNK